MQKLFVFLFIASAVGISCTNSTTTTETKHDSTVVTKDTGTHSETNGNAVTPPASNGQY